MIRKYFLILAGLLVLWIAASYVHDYYKPSHALACFDDYMRYERERDPKFLEMHDDDAELVFLRRRDNREDRRSLRVTGAKYKENYLAVLKAKTPEEQDEYSEIGATVTVDGHVRVTSKDYNTKDKTMGNLTLVFDGGWLAGCRILESILVRDMPSINEKEPAAGDDGL